jgi:hypothetical protein
MEHIEAQFTDHLGNDDTIAAGQRHPDQENRTHKVGAHQLSQEENHIVAVHMTAVRVEDLHRTEGCTAEQSDVRVCESGRRRRRRRMKEGESEGEIVHERVIVCERE